MTGGSVKNVVVWKFGPGNISKEKYCNSEQFDIIQTAKTLEILGLKRSVALEKHYGNPRKSAGLPG
jgi:hypothetical protein